MFKLSLREKVKFWRKNKIWLKKAESFQTCEQYGMIMYKSKDGSIWGAERVNKQTRITQISKEVNFDSLHGNCWYETYNYKKQTGYIFGRKGIFYTKSRESHWECIYSDENITGMMVNCQKGIVIVFRAKEKDVVYRINNGKLSEEALLQNVQIYHVNDEEIHLARRTIDTTCGDMKILVKTEDNTYSYYFITKNEMHNPGITFENYYMSTKFLNQQLVKAYSVKAQCNVLITLVNGKVKEHYYCDEVIKTEKYYLAKLLKDSKTHFLKYVNEEKIQDLGSVPESGEYVFVAELLGIDFYIVKSENGITLLAVNEGKLESKFYEGAIGIELSEPDLLKNGNIIELKPIVLYQKEIEYK